MALTGVLGVAPNALGVSLGRPGDALERLLGALGAPGAPQDRLWGGIWVSKTVPSASGRVPETALGAPTDPKSIFRRFFVDLGFIFDDFPAIFRRCSLKLPATKLQFRISRRSRVILTARLGSCVVLSLRTARASLEMACERFMFSLLSLRTHKLT